MSVCKWAYEFKHWELTLLAVLFSQPKGSITILDKLINKLIHNFLFGVYFSGSHVVRSDYRNPNSLGEWNQIPLNTYENTLLNIHIKWAVNVMCLVTLWNFIFQTPIINTYLMTGSTHTYLHVDLSHCGKLVSTCSLTLTMATFLNICSHNKHSSLFFLNFLQVKIIIVLSF